MKALVINLDIIMSPCITLYVDSIGQDLTDWDRVIDFKNLDKFFTLDAKIIKDIFKILKSNKSAKRLFIEEPSFKTDFSFEDEADLDYIGFFEEDILKKYSNYKWYGMPNSPKNEKYNNFSEFNLKNKYDKIIINFPKNRVPYRYYYLYEIMENLYD